MRSRILATRERFLDCLRLRLGFSLSALRGKNGALYQLTIGTSRSVTEPVVQVWRKRQPNRHHPLGIERKGVLSTEDKIMLAGNRCSVVRTRRTIAALLPSLFPAKGASKQRVHGSEPPVERTGQHRWRTS